MSDFISEPTVFRSTGAILGESLFFDGGEAMYWCDITAGVVHRSPLDGAVDGSADLQHTARVFFGVELFRNKHVVEPPGRKPGLADVLEAGRVAFVSCQRIG